MSNRLPVIQAAVAGLHGEVKSLMTRAADRALAAGELLIEAKALCQHGEWSNWLKSAGIPERSAQRYMALSRAGIPSAIVADLGFAECEKYASAASKLPALSEGQAACFKATDPQVDMSILAYAWPAGVAGTFHYVSYMLMGDEGFEITPRAPLPAWLVGSFHTGPKVDTQTVSLVPVQEAIDFREQVRAAA